MDEDVSFAPLLAQLLLEDWHDAHEGIVTWLGLIGDHGAVQAISRAARVSFPSLLRRRKLHEFQRKCAYALARIGTLDSRAALEELATSDDSLLREYAEDGLAMWPLPMQAR